MGYLLKEALKTLCGVNQWSYAIFWKIGCQNPKLLIWEECYYEPVIYSNATHGVQAVNKVHSLVTKMMKDNYINLLGEGLVGRVAFTKNHQWIISDNKMLHVHPPEVSSELCIQFSAGMQTIAVIPVHPHGVVQLGSSSTIIENMGFVNDAKCLISQLGCVPGALLSENYMKNEGAFDANPNHMLFAPDKQNFSFSGANLYNQDPKNDQQTAFESFSENYDPLRSMQRQILSSDAFLGGHVNDTIPCAHVDDPNLVSGKQKLEHELFQALTMSSSEESLRPPSRDDLFDVVGMDFKNKLFDKSGINLANNVVESNPVNLISNNGAGLELQGADSGIYSLTASDDLLDAVVSKVHSSSKQISDDTTSCRTSSTKTSCSSAPVVNSSSIWANGDINLMQSLKKSGLTSSCSYKSAVSKDVGNFSETSSIISSQISSWSDQKHEVRNNITKRGVEISKSNRKRLKPGENPRPRPKDRQMIQDRVKELREIVPNGAKCSIDALLERTIKHMIFLQSVTKHADKLKQTGESKIISKEGGLLLRDNFEGGATWAYEVGSQSMVCPIIVEDLNSPRQMLVEMLCEEQGLFLEIADIVRGLGLTILKGVMEYRNNKIWAHFTVEANRDVTRMEIFISLVSLFEQAVKNGAEAGDVSLNPYDCSAT